MKVFVFANCSSCCYLIWSNDMLTSDSCPYHLSMRHDYSTKALSYLLKLQDHIWAGMVTKTTKLEGSCIKETLGEYKKKCFPTGGLALSTLCAYSALLCEYMRVV